MNPVFYFRYLQRCPLAILQSDVVIPLVQCATQATQLDHREANVSVTKFLYDLIHSGRRQKEGSDYLERNTLVKKILIPTAPQLLCTLINGVIFTLPSYTINDIAEVFYEIKEILPLVSDNFSWNFCIPQILY